MKKTRMMILTVASAVTIGLSIMVGAFLFRVYIRQDDRPAIRAMASWMRLPVAKVGTRWIGYAEYRQHLDALRLFLRGSVAREQGLPLVPDASMKEQTLNRLLRTNIVEAFAKERGIAVSKTDVDDAYSELMSRAGTSTSAGEIDAFLRDQFGWNVEDFKRNIIRPAMLEDGLRKKKEVETKDAEAFEKELQARLLQDDVKRYLRFE